MFLYVGGMPSDHVAVWRLDDNGQAVDKVQQVDGLLSPSYLCKHPTRPLLYVAERRVSDEDKSSGAISTFAIGADGTLNLLGRTASGGAFTAHVNVTPDGRFLTTANPLGPTAAIFPLDENGLPGDSTSVMSYEGRGPLERQDAPWPHSSYGDKTSRRLFVCDMCLDRIFIYDINPQSGALTPAPQAFAQVSSGAGSRHMAINGDGTCLYVANELDSTVSVFHYDGEACRLAIAQTLSTVPADFGGKNQPAEIALGAGGRFLYITNRGHETVVVFAVDAETGKLYSPRYEPILGEMPRHIGLSGGGGLAALSNQTSGEVVLFSLDAETGAMSPTGGKIPYKNPTCAVFV